MAKDYSNATYDEMAHDMEAMRLEVRRRNPLFVNTYVKPLIYAEGVLHELAECETEREEDDD